MATTKLPPLTAGGSPVTVTKIAPLGSLQARKAKNGEVSFVWRWNITIDGELNQGREPIGLFDAALPPKSLKSQGGRFSLAAAERAAEVLAQAHLTKRKEGGIVGIRSAERAEKEAQKVEAETDEALSLSRLMSDYADLVEKRKGCHREIRSVIHCHIDTHDVAQKPARHVTSDDGTDILRAIVAKGVGRTVNKTRSYCNAAYEVARGARSNPSTPAHFKTYNITFNPFADTAVIDDNEGKPPKEILFLSLDELRTYWRIIKDIPGQRGGLLQLHLLTGGQRLEQLVRLVPENIHWDLDYFIIHDIKGGRGKKRTKRQRPHAVPLIPAAAVALKECAATDTWAFTTDGGATHVAGTTLSGWAEDAVGDAIPDFTASLIRSGVESCLSAAGIDKETRGRLQSHGISGVQDTHYNANDFMAEKRHALEVLFQLLQAPVASAKVVPLKRRTKKG
jgi:integrase